MISMSKEEEKMGPLFFHPVYKDYIWGGTNLKKIYGKDTPYERTAESWEIACHPNGMSIVSKGDFKGRELEELIEKYPEEILGKKLLPQTKFPLLIKLLDAADKLSIQVHPTNEYAFKHENGELGKSEMWYVLHAEPGASLVLGLKESVTKEQFAGDIERGRLEQDLGILPVEEGDIINIPAGMIHAVQEGIIIAEIQQNSDTVYRVYDWNRLGADGKPRHLHIEKALDVIDFQGKLKTGKVQGLSITKDGNTSTYYIANDFFAVEKLELVYPIKEDTKNEKFFIYICIKETGEVQCEGDSYSFKMGDTFMIPGGLGEYRLAGNTTVLKTYVPDIYMDFIKPLEEAGYSEEEILRYTRVR